MGICCCRAAAGELDDDSGFPWKHDDLFHEQLWTSAGPSMHTKQGWKGANQDAMTVSQIAFMVSQLLLQETWSSRRRHINSFMPLF